MLLWRVRILRGEDFYVTELQEYELYFETIVVGDRMFMTIDVSKYGDVFVRFYPSHFVIWIKGEPLEVNYPGEVEF